MRACTLTDPATLAALSRQFVLVTHNQLPELYCSAATVDVATYPAAQLANVTEGAGGNNIRTYFCTPEGRVVGFLAGMWRPPRYRAEAAWALARMGDGAAALAAAHRAHADAIRARRDARHPPAAVRQLLAQLASQAPTSPAERARRFTAYRSVAAFNRLIRSHHESAPLLGREITGVLRQVEDEVYTRGTLGCD